MSDRIDAVLQRAHAAAPAVAALPAERRAAVLYGLGDCMEAAAPVVLGINTKDVARAASLSDTRRARLKLTGRGLARARERLRRQAASAVEVHASPGVEVITLDLKPAAALEAFAVCLLDGKACVLVGAKELAETNCGVGKFITAVLKGCGCPEDACAVIYNATVDERARIATLHLEIEANRHNMA